MKKLLLFLALVALFDSLIAGEQTLLVFYSFTGNSRDIAVEIQKNLKVDLLEVIPEKTEDYAADSYKIGAQYINSINEHPDDASSYPSINAIDINVSAYENLIIITPLWHSHMAAPMQTFLFQNGAKMAGKSIAMIVTSHSSSIGGVVDDLKRLIPEGQFVVESLSVKNQNRDYMPEMVRDWVRMLPFNTEYDATTIFVSIDGKTYHATVDNTATGRAFLDMLPITLQMAELNYNEKYANLSEPLPQDDYSPRAIHTGDLMLYEGQVLVLFYSSFNSAYSYTRIGRIISPDGLAEAVGTGNVSVSFSLMETSLEKSAESNSNSPAYDLLGRRVGQNYHGITVSPKGKSIIL